MSFTLIEERSVPEIDSLARLYRHDATGARFLSIINKDENKAFGISLRTPPSRSDGVAHILEHSVLCGSEKYPVKEPFVELMKGSLNTFLNALTYPDKTVYPVASTNTKDFYNLVDVYMDAVLRPRITEDTFRQEGWHYEVDPETGALSYKGVVFNEMKGAYSDPDDLHDDLCRRSLFPDTAYGLDSGGDPIVIPRLDYATFKAFHEKYYHPSNSFIYFYGDDEPEKRLAFLDAWLAPYSRIEVASLPGLQAPFAAPISLTRTYEGTEPKAWTALNWALVEHGDQKTSLGLSILAHILTATPASPLRKALIDSGLGEDLAGFGLEDSLRRGAWSVGLKGVRPEEVAKVESLILAELSRLAEKGIDPDTVEASLNTVEFALREKNTGRFPRGLAVMLEALNEWLYDENPIEALSFGASLEAIKKDVAAGERYFEALIRAWFLDNPHRSTVTILPDPEEGKRRQAAEKAELDAARAGMSEAEFEDIKAAARRLHDLQEAPDSPEALASIPSLSLSDLPKEPARIPSEKGEIASSTLLFHDLPTSSILYLDLAFPLDGLRDDLVPYIGLLGRALLEMGTDALDYVTMSQEIGKHTGGIGATAVLTTKWRRKDAAAFFVVRGKALREKTPKLFELLESVLLGAKLDNKERFKQIVLEEKAQSEASLIPSGHRLVGLRLLSHLTAADSLSERINGIDQLFFLRRLAGRIDSDWEGVLADLRAAKGAVVGAAGMIVNATMEREEFEGLKPALEGFVAALRQGSAAEKAQEGAAAAQGAAAPNAATAPNAAAAQNAARSMALVGAARGGLGVPPALELFVAPSQVNFVGKAYPMAAAGAAPSGAFLVAKKYLDTTFLWEKVRVQGGAYGGFSMYDLNSGIFVFLSYRDPNLEKTLDIFANASTYLAALDIPKEELTRAIIGTIGGVDSYLLPDAKGFTSLVHYMTGYTYEDRQAMRDQILAASPEDFKALATSLSAAQPLSIAGALGSKQRFESLPKALIENAKILTLM
ncbi:MAG: insulinase family protein [Spirochaetales bacterium]